MISQIKIVIKKLNFKKYLESYMKIFLTMTIVFGAKAVAQMTT